VFVDLVPLLKDRTLLITVASVKMAAGPLPRRTK
jgi:hypothetical protein